MTATEDRQLVQCYADTGSRGALGELVRRHLDLVYAAARRQCRGEHAHLADDVTQAVFLVLARKASTIRGVSVLPAWLITTTRYTANNAIAMDRRRRDRERRAAQMMPEANRTDETDADAELLLSLLDEALANLGERDRGAVALRFLQGRSFRDVGVALGVSEEAAQKRVMRALVRLRAFFRRRGVMTASPGALAAGLSRQAARVAPAALPAVVLATLTNAGAAATTATTAVRFADASVRAMAAAARLKVAAVIAASILVVGIGVAVAASVSRVRGRTAGAVFAPRAALVDPQPVDNPLVLADPGPVAISPGGGAEVRFPNASIVPIKGGNTIDYTFGDDARVKRRPDGEPAVFIASRTQDAPPTATNGTDLAVIGSTTLTLPMLALRGAFVPAAAWQGKHLEVSGYLRTEDVKNATGIKVLVWGANRRLLASDMDSTALRVSGTTEWRRMSSVLDVPADAQRIEFGVGLWGPGRVWIDSVALREVPNTVPVTSDELWHVSTLWPTKFSLARDPSVRHAGRPAARLSSTGAGVESASLVRFQRSLDAYRGKRVRVLAMIKAQDVSGGAGVFAKSGEFRTDPSGAGSADPLSSRNGFDGGRRYVEVSSKNDLPVRDTLGWSKYATVLDVPASANLLQYGVHMEGAGTIWIDDVVLEVLPDRQKRGR